jgi:hypothetical protein
VYENLVSSVPSTLSTKNIQQNSPKISSVGRRSSSSLVSGTRTDVPVLDHSDAQIEIPRTSTQSASSLRKSLSPETSINRLQRSREEQKSGSQIEEHRSLSMNSSDNQLGRYSSGNQLHARRSRPNSVSTKQLERHRSRRTSVASMISIHSSQESHNNNMNLKPSDDGRSTDFLNVLESEKSRADSIGSDHSQNLLNRISHNRRRSINPHQSAAANPHEPKLETNYIPNTDKFLGQHKTVNPFDNVGEKNETAVISDKLSKETIASYHSVKSDKNSIHSDNGVIITHSVSGGKILQPDSEVKMVFSSYDPFAASADRASKSGGLVKSSGRMLSSRGRVRKFGPEKVDESDERINDVGDLEGNSKTRRSVDKENILGFIAENSNDKDVPNHISMVQLKEPPESVETRSHRVVIRPEITDIPIVDLNPANVSQTQTVTQTQTHYHYSHQFPEPEVFNLNFANDTLETAESEIYHPMQTAIGKFGKASTGRLNYKISNQKLKFEENVLLIGTKLETKAHQPTIPRTRPLKKSIPKKLVEPGLPSESPHTANAVYEKLNTDLEMYSKAQENVVIVTKGEVEVQIEPDSGVYRDISDVDTIVAHYAKLLETRKKKILLGFIDQAPITEFKEVPDFFHQVENEDDDEEQNDMDDDKKLKEKELAKSAYEANLLKEIKEMVANRKEVKSANSRTESASTCTCSCTTQSCSICKSRSSSAFTYREMKSAKSESLSKNQKYSNRPCDLKSVKKSKTLKPAVRFSDYQVEDPLVLPPKAEPTIIINHEADTVRVEIDSSEDFQEDKANVNEKWGIDGFKIKMNEISHKEKNATLPKKIPCITVVEHTTDSNSASNIDLFSKDPVSTVEMLQEEIDILAQNTKPILLERDRRSFGKQAQQSTPSIQIMKAKMAGTLKLHPALKPRLKLQEIGQFKTPDIDSILDNLPEILFTKLKKNILTKITPRSKPVVFNSMLDEIINPVENINNDESAPIIMGLKITNLAFDLSKDDALDKQVKNAIHNYQVEIIKREEMKRSLLQRRSKKKAVVIAEYKPDVSDYETEEFIVTRPANTRGKKLWEVVRKNFAKQALIKSFRVKNSSSNESLLRSTDELSKILEVKEQTEFEDSVDINDCDPKLYYFLNRRKSDMEKFPHLYAGKTINPITNKLEIETTARPIIGLSLENERKILPSMIYINQDDEDMESIMRFNIGHGLELNGFSGNSGLKLMECVHGLSIRLTSLSPVDRCKYQTFEDIGPPVDATGTPILDTGAVEPQKVNFDLLKEEKELDILIHGSEVPNPTYHRKRGFIFSRLEKFARAMEVTLKLTLGF